MLAVSSNISIRQDQIETVLVMTFSSAFPTKYVDRSDVDYRKVPWHQFILIPREDGSSPQDYIRTLADLQSALEIKSLADSVPHHSAAGRKLTVEFLRDEASSIICNTDVEWVYGCTGLLVIYHPNKERKLVEAMASLLGSPRSAGRNKLLSVQHEGRPYSFEIELYPNDRMAEDGLILGLINPSDPAVVRLAEKDREGNLTFTNLYADKETMEWFAFNSISTDLSCDLGITPKEINGKYEPLGDSTYPDFEISFAGQEWAVEVARVESGMTSYVPVDRRLDQRGLNRAFGNYITDARVGETLRNEVNQKAQIRSKCPRYSRHCLLLVDVVDAVGAKGSSDWDECDLSAFDVVGIIRMDGSVDYIKGQFATDSVS